jgi:hypothetical protein
MRDILRIADRIAGRNIRLCLDATAPGQVDDNGTITAFVGYTHQSRLEHIRTTPNPRLSKFSIGRKPNFLFFFGKVTLAFLQYQQSNSSSIEDLPIAQDTGRLDNCISQLRDIIGDTAPREQLVQVVLAADYDLCRAVNFYYARNQDDE